MATGRKRSEPTMQPSRRAQLAAQQQAAARARKRNRILTLVAAGVGVALLVFGLVLQPRSPRVDPPTAASTAGETVRTDSHRLTDVPNARVTFVEFLDFECEACGAAYPSIEQLRASYGDRVSFVVRYFPLEGHFNAQRAARAVEAAAQQDKFEAMYKKMFETQKQWGEQQVPHDDLFRQFAVELGLDMTRWDTDYASDTTWARIKVDIDDGNARGVTGTPAFFVNGQRLQPKSFADVTAALDQALD